MLESIFKRKLDRFIVENWTLRLVVGFLTMIVIWQQMVLSSRITGQRTVFMPPKIIDKEFWVAGNTVSSSYLEMMSQFIVYNLFNVTPQTALINGENVLALVQPEFYSQVDQIIKTQLNYLVDNQVSRTFYLSGTDTKTPGKIIVKGILKELVSDKQVSRKKAEINISYIINDGRFWIVGIEAEEQK